MSTTYVLFFTSSGYPKTGLTPSIITYKKVSDNSDVGSPPSISEIGGGGYKFAATLSEPLFVVVDGGSVLADYERYKVMQITPNDGSLDAAVSTVKTQTDKLAFSVTNQVDANVIDWKGAAAPKLANISVADIIAGISEGDLDLKALLKIFLAALAGKSSGGGTSTVKFRDYADGKYRITATVDASVDRIAVILDGS